MTETAAAKLGQPRLKLSSSHGGTESTQAAISLSRHHHAVMDALLDTQTGNYITNSSVQSIENEVYIRLITPLGSYWADIELGSRLHLLKREKDVIRIQMLARQYAEQALQPILDGKRATSIQVRTESIRRGWLTLWIEATDATGLKVSIEHHVSVL